MSTPRLVHTSVTNFLYCGDYYLFLLRGADKKVDANRLNGIGGKLELGENYVDAAIRETKEEAGFDVAPKDIQLSGLIKLEGGYEQDWVFCIFKIEVPTMELPLGTHTPDGELMWLHKDEALKTGHEMVSDLEICFPKIVAGKEMFFMNLQVNAQEKIKSYTLQSLPTR